MLVCRPRPADAPIATRCALITALKAELPAALAAMQHANLAPVDLAQAAIGSGMAIFTRFSRVVDAQGAPVRVREALALINQAIDEALSEQESDFDAATRWALSWFAQYGFDEGAFGDAETLAKARNTSVEGLVAAGMLAAGRERVRLQTPDEQPGDWDPARLRDGGAHVRRLAYRLYVLSEQTQRVNAAWTYNALVQRWAAITRLAQQEIRMVVHACADGQQERRDSW